MIPYQTYNQTSSKRRINLSNFLNHAFQCQSRNNKKPPTQQSVSDNENNDCNVTNEAHVELMQGEITCEWLKEEIEKRSVSKTSKHNLAAQLKSAKKKCGTLKNKLTFCLNKLSHLPKHNVNKRLKSQKGNFQLF